MRSRFFNLTLLLLLPRHLVHTQGAVPAVQKIAGPGSCAPSWCCKTLMSAAIRKFHLPPLPPNKFAVGFLPGDWNPAIVSQAMDYIITAKAPPGTNYKRHNPASYPGLLGMMLWTLNYDRYDGYNFSNLVGPQLHAYPPVK